MRRETTFLAVTPTMRLRIETTIENLMALLDEIEGDENLEETGDDEPWLAWGARGPSAWGDNQGDDREADDSDDEDGGDSEPSLGSTGCRFEHHSQEHWADGARGDHEREDENEHGGGPLF